MANLRKGRLDTFGDLVTDADSAEWHQQRNLKIIASDISAGEMRVLPDDLPLYGLDASAFSVAEAVRLSMSIPFFFEPGDLAGNTVVDGGILSNLPLWLYDAPVGVRPVCLTIGFQLVDRQSGTTVKKRLARSRSSAALSTP